jgi:hypothetical protein
MPETKRRWRPNFKLSNNMALITGLTMGVLAAVIQGYFGLHHRL